MKLSIILLLLCNICFSQTNDVLTVLKERVDVTLHESVRLNEVAKTNAQNLLSSYDDSDPMKLQSVIDGLDDSWYNSVDVFIGGDIGSVLEYIRNCKEAYFFDHSGNVLIDVSENYELCLVTVYMMQ